MSNQRNGCTFILSYPSSFASLNLCLGAGPKQSHKDHSVFQGKRTSRGETGGRHVWSKVSAPKGIQDQICGFLYLICSVWFGPTECVTEMTELYSLMWIAPGLSSVYRERKNVYIKLQEYVIHSPGLQYDEASGIWNRLDFWNVVDLIASWQLVFSNYVWLSLIVKSLCNPQTDPGCLQRGQRQLCLQSWLPVMEGKF